MNLQKQKNSLYFKAITLVLALSLIFPPRAFSQGVVLNLPAPGSMVSLSQGFTPTLLKGIKIYPDNPLKFDFIVDTGDEKLEGDALKKQSEQLIKYFLASLTVPEKELWVNLSPYEKDKIIPQSFGETEMGRDLLAQDYILKQLTASLIYPENDLGKEFWNRVYIKARELYGTTDIPINTFNKVWIIPDKAVVYAKDDRAFVTQSHFNVMLEEDYLSLNQSLNNKQIGTDKLESSKVKEVNNISSQIIKELVLPEIEKEVNSGKNFALLRQAQNSLILAVWYKKALKESLLSKVYVNQHKTKGIDLEDKQTHEKIYQQYLEALKKGVFNYIKEDYDSSQNKAVSRKYFSGGVTEENVEEILEMTAGADDVAIEGTVETISVTLNPVKNLDRLRRILNVLAQSDHAPEVPQDASEDMILEFVLSHLETTGFIKEARNEDTDVKVFIIKDAVKETELGKAIKKWVMDPQGGVKAINFKGTDGIWKIVGFESEIDQQLDLEREEVKQRKAGKHWIAAYNEARKKVLGVDSALDQQEAAQKYKVARQDILSASAGAENLGPKVLAHLKLEDNDRISRRSFLGMSAAGLLSLFGSPASGEDTESFGELMFGRGRQFANFDTENMKAAIKKIANLHNLEQLQELMKDQESIVSFLLAINYMFQRTVGVYDAMANDDKSTGMAKRLVLNSLFRHSSPEESFETFHDYANYFDQHGDLFSLTHKEKETLMIWSFNKGLDFDMTRAGHDSILVAAEKNFIAAAFIKLVIHSSSLSVEDKVRKLKDLPRDLTEFGAKVSGIESGIETVEILSQHPLIVKEETPDLICRESAAFIQGVLPNSGVGKGDLALVLAFEEDYHIVYLFSEKINGQMRWGYVGFNPSLHYEFPEYESLEALVRKAFPGMGARLAGVIDLKYHSTMYVDRNTLVKIEDIDRAYEKMIERGATSTKPESWLIGNLGTIGVGTAILGTIGALFVALTKRKARIKSEENSSEIGENASVRTKKPIETRTLPDTGEFQKGGIDLNPANLNLQTQGETLPFQVPSDPKEWQNIHIDGFAPIIIKITPVMNLPLLLGSSRSEEKHQS